MKRFPLMLVADDDENDLHMIARALPRDEPACPVRFLHDGAEVLDYLYARGQFAQPVPERPGLLLLDLHMPRRNGWDVLREVKGDACLRSIPIVIFSSSDREPDIRSCYELGATAYVVKPVDPAAFRQAVERIQAFWILCNRTPERGAHALPPARITPATPPAAHGRRHPARKLKAAIS